MNRLSFLFFCYIVFGIYCFIFASLDLVSYGTFLKDINEKRSFRHRSLKNEISQITMSPNLFAATK